MTPRQTFSGRSDDDDNDLVEASDVVNTKPIDASESLERGSNNDNDNNKHDLTRINTVGMMSDRDSTDNNASRATDKQESPSSSLGQAGNKQRNRGRTRRHYSRKQACLSACKEAWETRSSFDMDTTTKSQATRPSARSSSAKRSDKRVPGLVIESMTPVCERAASEPTASSMKTVSSTAEGGQRFFERVRSYPRKAPHEVHREMVKKLSSNDDGSALVSRQLSYGVARLMSEEDRLEAEDGAILSGGVYKRKCLSKRGSLDNHYEKGSIRDLERLRSKASSGTAGSGNSATDAHLNNVQ
ncbi:hypothetical protein FGB62_94g058 [Gracilaria domingensis]|nr:hypothetical protein FGB62_94g058 [Gracilaria domingensis]